MVKCAGCANQAVLIYKTEHGDLPVCLDCNLKYQQAATLQHDRLVRTQNLLVGMMENQTGLPRGSLGYVPDPPPRPLNSTAVTMNNIKIEGSTIGVLNTGTIQKVDAAVTVLKKSGEQDAASAITKVTEAVAASNQLTVEDKNQLLELLSLVSTEATAPKEQRRVGAMRAILGQITTLVGGAVAVAELWRNCEALIKSLFGM